MCIELVLESLFRVVFDEIIEESLTEFTFKVCVLFVVSDTTLLLIEVILD